VPWTTAVRPRGRRWSTLSSLRYAGRLGLPASVLRTHDARTARMARCGELNLRNSPVLESPICGSPRKRRPSSRSPESRVVDEGRLDLGTRRSRIGDGLDSGDDGLTILPADDIPEVSPPANRFANGRRADAVKRHPVRSHRWGSEFRIAVPARAPDARSASRQTILSRIAAGIFQSGRLSRSSAAAGQEVVPPESRRQLPSCDRADHRER